jgi:hypothetical protein
LFESGPFSQDLLTVENPGWFTNTVLCSLVPNGAFQSRTSCLRPLEELLEPHPAHNSAGQSECACLSLPALADDTFRFVHAQPECSKCLWDHVNLAQRTHDCGLRLINVDWSQNPSGSRLVILRYLLHLL